VLTCKFQKPTEPIQPTADWLGSSGAKVFLISNSKTPGINEQPVYILLRPLMKPGAANEVGKRFGDWLVETLGRGLRPIVVLGGGGGGGRVGSTGAPPNLFASLFVGFPIGLLALSGAIKGRVAFGAKSQGDLGRCLLASRTGIRHVEGMVRLVSKKR
jgi:hypothetical protein